MMFGGWFSGGGSMAGMSGMMVNGGLAYADRWPPMVLTLDLYRAAEEDDIPKKWRNLARHARKKRTPTADPRIAGKHRRTRLCRI